MTNTTIQTWIKLTEILNKKEIYRSVNLIILTLISGILEVSVILILSPTIESIFDKDFSEGLINSSSFNIPLINNLPFTAFNLLAFFIFLLISNALVKFLLLRKQLIFSNKIGRRIGFELVKKKINLSYEEHILSRTSETINQQTFFVEEFTHALNEVVRLITALTLTIFIVLSLLKINFFLTIYITFITAIIYLIMKSVTKKKLLRNGKLAAIQNKKRISLLESIFISIRLIILENNQKIFLENYKNTDFNIWEIRVNNAVIRLLPRLIVEPVIIIALIIAAFLMANPNLPFQQELALGQLSSFALASQRLLPYLQQIFSGYTSLQFRKEAIDDIFEEFKNEKDYLQKKKIKNKSTLSKKIFKNKNFKSLKIKGVDFSFSKGLSKNIFENFSLEINRGDKVLFQGPSGCGKSTLVDIACFLLTPKNGEIFVNDKKLTTENSDLISWWRGKISIVPQKIFIINDTFVKNIIFPSEIYDKKKLHSSMSKAFLDQSNFALDLFKDNVGENGARLSGGQIQRLGLARAFYNKRDILILDEATTGIPEKMQYEILLELLKDEDLTLIVISHDTRLKGSFNRVISF